MDNSPQQKMPMNQVQAGIGATASWTAPVLWRSPKPRGSWNGLICFQSKILQSTNLSEENRQLMDFFA